MRRNATETRLLLTINHSKLCQGLVFICLSFGAFSFRHQSAVHLTVQNINIFTYSP